jgi:hypothetical protein
MSTRRGVRSAASLVKALATRDALNLVRYGRGAPRYAERLWIDPEEITGWLRLPERADMATRSGCVVPGDWDLNVGAGFNAVVQACVDHWRDGVPWEETGAYESAMRAIEHSPGGEFDGCRTLDDVVARHHELDRLHAQVLREGRLRARDELLGHRFRELGGILVHVDRRGRLIWGGDGSHRLGIALALGLERAPAMLGAVHADAVRTWCDDRATRSGRVGERALRYRR